MFFIKYSSKYRNSCYPFSFFHNFKLKTEVNIDYKSLLVTELNKFRVIELLHFHKGILQSNVAEFTFKKLPCVLKDTFYCIRQKD